MCDAVALLELCDYFCFNMFIYNEIKYPRDVSVLYPLNIYWSTYFISAYDGFAFSTLYFYTFNVCSFVVLHLFDHLKWFFPHFVLWLIIKFWIFLNYFVMYFFVCFIWFSLAFAMFNQLIFIYLLCSKSNFCWLFPI